jgi:hypothetical protein
LLEELQLQCNIDDGGPFKYRPYFPPETQITAPFQCPVLWKLAIDGPNFYNICEKKSWSGFTALTSLAISHDTKYPSCSPEKILSALRAAPNITQLHLADVDLDLGDDTELDIISPIFLHSLVCEDVCESDNLKYLIESIDDIENLTLTRCTIGTATFAAETLALNAIDDDELDPLDTILCFWSGENLHLDRCSGFDDPFLERACVAEDGMIASSMKYLDISNCPYFSVPALKRFVEFRNGPDSSCTALERMRISGSRPSFSPEDLLWFKEHLIDFSVS